MRYLIISDLHANWEGLSAVLADAEGLYDSVLCCGDVVGYGADPNLVTEWVRNNASTTIRGNHDRACASLTGIEWFNPFAQAASLWTHDELSDENREWLQNLPQGPAAVEDFQIVHGSPLDEDEYLLTIRGAEEAFAYTGAPLTFFGHTHVQGGFEHSRLRTRRWSDNEGGRPVTLDDTCAYLINPGSTGQPRDGDPRAAYALFDRGRRLLELRRVVYNVAMAQKKILAANLPAPLAQRLASGQ